MNVKEQAERKEKIAGDIYLRWLLANFAYAFNYQMAEIIADKAKSIFTFFGAEEIK